MKIHGKKRVYGVTVAKVDENLREIPGTEFEIKCDMIIVSTGLIPRVELLERSGVNLDPATRSVVVNELLETSTSGVYVAGNALIINDLADSAAVQGELAAKSAVDFVQNGKDSSVCWKSVIKGRNIRCVVPQLVSCQRDVSFYGRVVQPEENVYLKIPEIQAQFHHLKVKPPEMFTFNINKNKLEKLKDNKITVAIEHIK